MRILNLYAGIGGNRAEWGNKHKITAVEFNKKIADVYHKIYPSDQVVIGCAKKYLLDNYKNFDFVWASPPCQSHSRARQYLGVQNENNITKAIYPDLSLYEIILFLQSNFDGNWIVENVIPYYKPLVPAVKISRHLFWSNKNLKFFETKGNPKTNIRGADLAGLSNTHKIDLSGFDLKGLKKAQILKNMVDAGVGKALFDYVNEKVKKPQLELLG